MGEGQLGRRRDHSRKMGASRLHAVRTTRWPSEAANNLYAEIVRLLEPAYQKARVEPWNDLSHFNFVGGEKERGEGAHLESDGRQIRFDVDATNNPKPMEPPVK